MPGGRPPGPHSQTARPIQIKDGTCALTATPRPGTLGANVDDVRRWDLQRKLLTAAERAGKYLPGESRAQFMALFSPEAIGITAAVLIAWAASHAFIAGEVLDLVAFLAAVVFLGAQAFQVGKDLGTFLRIAAGARSQADLDAAAMHLAAAVATVGVTVFVGIIFKAGAKLGGRVGAAAAARLSFFGRSAEEWLVIIGKPKAPPLVRERLETALTFFRENLPKKPAASIEGYLKGIDLSQPVKPTTIARGQEVVMYGDPKRMGLFYTKVGTSMNRLGINPGGREFVRLRFKQAAEALESRASPFADTWTEPGSRPLVGRDGHPVFRANGAPAVAPAKYQAGGGGTQYVIPDMQKLIDSGVVEVVKKP